MIRLLIVLLIFFPAVAKAFQEPLCIKPNIDFWEAVYTKFDVNDAIIHNTETFQIYAIYQLPENKKIRKEKVQKYLDFERSRHPDINPDNIRMQTGVSSRFKEGLMKASILMPLVVKELQRNGLPLELAYIPFVESMYNVNAVSKAKAYGMWQILKPTARSLGLKDTTKLKDPKVSTEIAIKYFLYSFERIPNWDLVIYSYHSGVAGMQRAVSVSGLNVCKIYLEHPGKYWKFASKNYLAQFYAIRRLVGRPWEE